MITMEMVGAALYDNNLHKRINEAKFVANFTQKMCKNNYILSNLLSYDIAPLEIYLEKWLCRTALYRLPDDKSWLHYYFRFLCADR